MELVRPKLRTTLKHLDLLISFSAPSVARSRTSTAITGLRCAFSSCTPLPPSFETASIASASSARRPPTVIERIYDPKYDIPLAPHWLPVSCQLYTMRAVKSNCSLVCYAYPHRCLFARLPYGLQIAHYSLQWRRLSY